MTLVVDHLTVTIRGREVVRDVSLNVAAGQRFGVIGASGSGKTVLSLAIAGLLPEGAEVSGLIELDGVNLLELDERERAAIRGDRIGMVFQEPKSALNPLQQLGKQVTESLSIHYQLSRQQRADAALRLAERVGIDAPERIFKSFPHQVSGGQRQRIAIAAAIAAQPQLLIADEPTTALDVTVQQGILELFTSLTETDRMALIFITHDIAVLAQVASHAIVLDEGRIIESGSVTEVIERPRHSVTQALIAAAQLTALHGGDSA